MPATKLASARWSAAIGDSFAAVAGSKDGLHLPRRPFGERDQQPAFRFETLHKRGGNYPNLAGDVRQCEMRRTMQRDRAMGGIENLFVCDLARTSNHAVNRRLLITKCPFI